IMNKHDRPHGAILWIMVVMNIPIIGILLYVLFGINRIKSTGIAVNMAHRIMLEKKKKLASIGKNGTEIISGKIDEEINKALLSHAKEQQNHIYYAKDQEYELFNMALDRTIPDSIPLAGNKLELLSDGTKAYPRMLEEINSAKSSIHLQSFIIMNDPVGREILGALEKKSREEGVEVKVLYDRFGSFKARMLFRQYQSSSNTFSIKPFAPLFSFRMPWTVQLRNHRKLLVIDGNRAFIGGINISSNNDSRWAKKDKYIHDLHCFIKGPAVGELQFAFLKDWFYATAEPIHNILKEKYFPILKKEGDSVVRVISSGPGQEFEATEKVFMCALMTAQKQIWIMTPYFVPDTPFCKAACAAVAKGVEIKILVPRKNNHWYVQFASQSLYPQLLEAGIRIFEKEGSFSHAKAMLVDGAWGYMGSSNCDVRSFRLNFELDFVVSKGRFLEDLHLQFLSEFAEAKEVRFEEAINKNIFQKFAENSCSLLTPIL
ncbi:MAG: cardiolipin synthase, partial [Candidatus Nanoarchaeia archaeon]